MKGLLSLPPRETWRGLLTSSMITISMEDALRLLRTVEGVVVVAEEGLDLDPDLGQGLALEIVRDLDQDPSHGPDPVRERKKIRIPSLVPAPSPVPKSGLSPAQDPKEEASPALDLARSLAQDQDHDPSLVIRKEIRNLVPDPSQRDQSPALVQRSAPSLGLDPTVQSPDLDLGQNPEGTSVPPQDPTVRIEKQRKLAVAQNPVQHQGLNHQWKMGRNLDPDQTQRLQKKWSKTEEIRSLSKMEMSESHYFDVLKNNVFFLLISYIN